MLLVVAFAVRKCFIDLTGLRYVREDLFKVCQLQKQTQLAWMILGGSQVCVGSILSTKL